MDSPLPSNDDVIAYSQIVPWREIEHQKRRFNERLHQLSQTSIDDTLPLEDLADAAQIPLSVMHTNSDKGNVILAHVDGRAHIMGSFVSKRYRHDKTLLQGIVPYNFNPSVNHTNLSETDDARMNIRSMGAELELGLFHRDGSAPSEEEVQEYSRVYRASARTLGITPQVDREACQYQVEVHVSPGVGYNRARKSLDSIMQSLVIAGKATNLQTAIMSAYPIKSNFDMTDNDKVHTAIDVMVDINSQFPEYVQRLAEAKKRYHINDDAHVVQVFRLQGCHIHLDIAGRSEALGLFTFYTLLRSATAIAGAAVLKGGPFVNGTCDPEYICTREYLRRTTVTGRYLELPISPHLTLDGLQRYVDLIQSERANAPARALLCEGGLGQDISVMHNPLGRVRPDLGTKRRICTIESTGMPVNISASRQAAILADFEYTHTLVEHYYRKYGLNLEPLYEDKTLLAILGPLSTAKYAELQDYSDREGTDIELETAAGTTMSLDEFYEMKRIYMHRHLIDVSDVMPREIDDVYTSLNRMLNPPSGRVAETIEHYVADPMRRSTGNWGKILRNAFIEEGGTPGSHNPDAVLRVANRVHEALCQRYV